MTKRKNDREHQHLTVGHVRRSDTDRRAVVLCGRSKKGRYRTVELRFGCESHDRVTLRWLIELLSAVRVLDERAAGGAT